MCRAIYISFIIQLFVVTFTKFFQKLEKLAKLNIFVFPFNVFHLSINIAFHSDFPLVKAVYKIFRKVS